MERLLKGSKSILFRLFRCFAVAALMMLILTLQLTPVDAQEDDVSVDAAGVGAIAPGWIRSRIEPSANVLDSGKSSIAVRASDGTTFISFYDATNKELRIAVQVTPGSGNCGNNGRWHCTTVDSAGDAGRRNAIVINSLTNLPVIAYSADDKALKYATASACTAGACTWTITAITSVSGSHKIDGVDVAFSTNDNKPHIAFTQNKSTSGDGNNRSLHYASFVQSGGNCGNGAWRCDTIDEQGRGVITFALAVNAQGRARIAYSRYDRTGDVLGPTHLYYAAYTIQGGNCGPQVNSQFTWTCHELLKVTDYDPLEVDLVLDGSNVHLAYARYSNSKLYYMNLIINNPNANCGPSNGWYCAEIETLGSSPSQIDGVSIAMAEGKPVIAYNDRNDLNRAILKVAQPISGAGNCGPDGGLFPTWECLIVDDGIRLFASSVNLGKPAIAYYAQYKVLRIAYNDETNDNLLLVQNRLSTPFVNALTPNTIVAGSSDLEVTVTGNSFGDEAWIIIDNTYVPTNRISSSELRTTISASALVTAGEKQIQVCNPPFPLSDCSNVLSFTVTAKQDQTISFATLPDRTLGDPPFTVSATASSALAVVFASTTPAICTVNGNTVTLLTTGSCSVVASQPGNTVYNAAQPVTRTFQVQPAGQANQQSIYLPMISR